MERVALLGGRGLLFPLSKSYQDDHHYLCRHHRCPEIRFLSTWHPGSSKERQQPSICFSGVCRLRQDLWVPIGHKQSSVSTKQWPSRAHGTDHEEDPQEVWRPVNGPTELPGNPSAMVQPEPSGAADGATHQDTSTSDR